MAKAGGPASIPAMRKRIVFLAAFVSGPLFAAEIPWPEHPRPDFQRSPWVNLNGKWDFAFDPQNVGEKEGWFHRENAKFERQIVVPFPWESRLSGIGDTKYQGVAWYAREITMPGGEGWDGKDAWLIVGACDFSAKVWVNGEPAGEHTGGYLPFEANLSWYAKTGRTAWVVIRAEDRTDPQQPTGKQIGWYTRTSGIWQTVYIEPRGRLAPGIGPGGPRMGTFIEALRGVADIKTGTMVYTVKVNLHQPCWLRLTSPEGEFEEARQSVTPDHSEVQIQAKVRQARLWSPESPRLYSVRFELAAGNNPKDVRDIVETYFGLREITTAKAPERDYKYIYLNGKPIYLMGLLHQSFHPDGVYQYPDDATMRGDYELCKKTGINFVRIHIKTPIPRELYWADKLGVMVMQDMPNFWKYSDQAKKWYTDMLDAAVARDFNHPAIFAWVNFNETWGIGDGGYNDEHQQWVADIQAHTRRLDPSRLIEDNSPCNYDHVSGDINSWHFYINDYAKARDHIQEVVDKTHPGSTFNYVAGHMQSDAPLINSEYGGISASHGDQDVSWCFKYLTNELRKHDKICGYIYTELSDIEWEHNGFVNYDRSPKEFGYEYWFPGFSLKDLNADDFVVIDAPPYIVMNLGESREIPIYISHWSNREGKNLKLRSRLYRPADGLDTFGKDEQAVTWKPFEVVSHRLTLKAGLVELLEQPVGLNSWQVELIDGDEVIARNYINVEIGGDVSESDQYTSYGKDFVYLAFHPRDYADAKWSGSFTAPSAPAPDKVSGVGEGYFEYRLRLPDPIKVRDVAGVQFFAEWASRGGEAKLDWPERRRSGDYPQTDVRRWPTQVRITVNGCRAHLKSGDAAIKGLDGGLFELPDDPADARGVRTHVAQIDPGSYGYLVHALAELNEPSNPEGNVLTLRLEVPSDAKHKGGLSVFGRKLGRFGQGPLCRVQLKRALEPGSAGSSDERKLTREIKETPAIDRMFEAIRVLMPTAEKGGHTWRYTTQAPAAEWIAADFDDMRWKSGKGGFGTPETPNTIIGTRWKTADIWLRAEVEIDDPARIQAAAWRIYHDEDVEIHLNGKRVLKRDGHVTQYEDVPLDKETLALLRKGRNVIAVHCHQTGGGQNVDVGLTVTRSSNERN